MGSGDNQQTNDDCFQERLRRAFVGEADRHKTWDELTPDERIERLRECLRSKDMAIQDLRQMVHTLMNHTHGRNGELLGPLFGYGGQQSMSRSYDPLA